ncbi:M35 family metallo-endopeptidase [Caballeronia sp.]|uniref:M35 family metallo-endopeptidase n=1 Tax=Caballeronia sp. TaxID=1931223 RepID=UPI003C70013F
MTDAEFRKSVLKLTVDANATVQRRLTELTRWAPIDRERVQTWFGTNDEATRASLIQGLGRLSKVLVGLAPKNFIRSSPDTDLATGCTPNLKNLSGEVAHVCAPDTATHTISISPNFCQLPDRSAGRLDSKQLTIVHEASHFHDTFGSLDHAYTQYNTRRLAQSNPERAIAKADSIAWYVLCTD